jgi:hypothetical protein
VTPVAPLARYSQVPPVVGQAMKILVACVALPLVVSGVDALAQADPMEGCGRARCLPLPNGSIATASTSSGLDGVALRLLRLLLLQQREVPANPAGRLLPLALALGVRSTQSPSPSGSTQSPSPSGRVVG